MDRRPVIRQRHTALSGHHTDGTCWVGCRCSWQAPCRQPNRAAAADAYAHHLTQVAATGGPR